jgi:hypothetical protein
MLMVQARSLPIQPEYGTHGKTHLDDQVWGVGMCSRAIHFTFCLNNKPQMSDAPSR